MSDKKQKRDRTPVVIVILVMFTALFMAVAAHSIYDIRKMDAELIEQQKELLRLQEQRNQQPVEQIIVVEGNNEGSEEQKDIVEEGLVDKADSEYVCISGGTVRVYQYPDATSAVLGRLVQGDRIVVLREYTYYYAIEFEGDIGYVQRRNFAKSGFEISIPHAVDLRVLLPDAEFDLLFASPKNITGRSLYPAVPILEEDTAFRLLEAYQIFKEDGYLVKICDAYRPHSAQVALYEIVQDSNFIANPNRGGSWHQRGRAIDMTLVDIRTGQELEMPTPMHTFSHDSARYNSEQWTEEARLNVDYMTSVMESVGFNTISTEWWHFENTRDTGYYLDSNIDLSQIYQ